MKAITGHNKFLYVEFAVICVIIPSLIIFNTWAHFMFFFLWGTSLYAAFIYQNHFFSSWKNLWKWDAVNRKNLKPVVLRWLLASLGMLAFMMWYDPEHLFYLPKNNPDIIPRIMVFYPVFSALPQEFIFCTWFFARFKPFFGEGKKMILASALVFAYCHILYINPVAPTLSLLGGLIFALTYAKTKSLALVTIEHALYGNTLFVTGLGWYFYSGAVGAH